MLGWHLRSVFSGAFGLAWVRVRGRERTLTSSRGQPRAHCVVRHREIVGYGVGVLVRPIFYVVREAALQQRGARGPTHGLRGYVVFKVNALFADCGAEVWHDVEVRLLPIIVKVVRQYPKNVWRCRRGQNDSAKQNGRAQEKRDASVRGGHQKVSNRVRTVTALRDAEAGANQEEQKLPLPLAVPRAPFPL